MTKVQLEYNLVRPLNGEDAKSLGDVHSWYGIIRVKPAPGLDKVTVEFDASRLTEQDVEATMHRFGIPIERKWAIP